jgi:hypothetical protein
LGAEIGLELPPNVEAPEQLLKNFHVAQHEEYETIIRRLVEDAPAIKVAVADVEQAKADLAQAKLDLLYTDVVAEIDGVVTGRNVNPGNNVQAGQSLMAVRSLTEIWIDASFKETQLADLRIGQRVRCEIDMYLYGPSERYVSRQRMDAMLEQEFVLLRDRLVPARGDSKCFFAFADTVATRGYRNPTNGHGWVGVRFQTRPRQQPSEIIVHAHLCDASTARQQEALGVLGVNLIYGAFYRRKDLADLIASLMDELSRERIDLDMIKLSGPALPGVDNRLMSLQFVERGLTDAAMFTASGGVVEPSDVLHKKPILVERGSFRPATKLTLDLLQRAREKFLQEPRVRGLQPVVLAEMTLHSLTPEPDVVHTDFLARADILRTLGFDVLVSRFGPY